LEKLYKAPNGNRGIQKIVLPQEFLWLKTFL